VEITGLDFDKNENESSPIYYSTRLI